MSEDRELPFDPDVICEGCGKQGAYDCMGDWLCWECIDGGADDEEEEE